LIKAQVSQREGRLLQLAFLAGAITDAGALVPMLSPPIAALLWGLHDTSGTYRFAMGYAASLMLGWTLLLLWAYRRPVERRAVAALTVVVLVGLVVAEVCAVHYGVLAVGRMVPTWALQAILLALFGAAFYSGRSRQSVAA
jgi:peptidoglycan/LPS O-acetylase OafA/YrhL